MQFIVYVTVSHALSIVCMISASGGEPGRLNDLSFGPWDQTASTLSQQRSPILIWVKYFHRGIFFSLLYRLWLLILCSDEQFGPIMADKYMLDLLAENKWMHNTGCQHACVKMPPGFFQKMVEKTLCKDLQDIRDPQKPSGITEVITDHWSLEGWDNTCLNGTWKKLLLKESWLQ